MDFCTVALKADLIHELIDQEDATSVVGIYILAHERVGQFFRLEAGARVANHNEHAALLVAGDATLYALGGVVLAAMEDGVGKGLAQGGFDLKFLAGSTFHTPGHLHDAFHHRTDAARVGVECNLNSYHRVGATRRAGKRPPAGISSPPSSACVTVTPLIRAVKQESERWRDSGTLVLNTRGEMHISSGLRARNLTIPEPNPGFV